MSDVEWHEIRAYLKNKVTDLLREAADDQRCRVLYFQGRGGLGKTYLLAKLNELPAVREFNAMTCEIEDMAYPETRKPLQLEQNLARKLRRSAQALNDPRIAEQFERYEALFDRYNTFDKHLADAKLRQQSDQARKQAFIDAWNTVSAHRLLIGRFDTMELLLGDRPADALINQPEATVGMRAVIDWLTDVLPRLRHTLVIFAGRAPSRPSIIETGAPYQDLDSAEADHNKLANNELVLRLNAIGLLQPSDFVIVQRLYSDADLLSYITYYGLDAPPHAIEYIRTITDGVPLLLTLYAESQRQDRLPFEVSLTEVGSRRAFEERLVDTVLNPLRYTTATSDPSTRPRLWLIYCLHILSYARRGLSCPDLDHVLRRVDPHAVLNAALLEDLRKLALVRQMPPLDAYEGENELLYLHDEIWLLIDESLIAEELGFKDLILHALEEQSRERVAAISQSRKPAGLLRAMCDHTHYALTLDITRGYRHYLVYMDHLFAQRNFEDALVLADVFWRMLELRVVRFGTNTPLYRELIAEAKHLSYEVVRRYDRIHYSKLLLALGNNAQAVREAEQLYAELVRRDSIPAPMPHLKDLDVLSTSADGRTLLLSELVLAEGAPLRRTFNPDDVHSWPSDLHLFADLLLTWAHALTLRGADPADLADDPNRPERIFKLLTDLLNDSAHVEHYLTQSRATFGLRLSRDDNLLRLRRTALLGRAYQIDGQRLRQRLEYDDALDRQRLANAAFQSYDRDAISLPEESVKPVVAAIYLNDHIQDELALGLNSIAYLHAEIGLLDGAKRRTANVVERYSQKVRPYYRALMLNTRIEILMRADEFPAADALLAAAQDAAQESEVPRAQGLVALSRARIERWKMNQAHEPRPNVGDHYQAALSMLAAEASTYRDVLDEYARYLRDLAFWYEHDQQPDLQRRDETLLAAHNAMQEAIEKLPLDASQPLLSAELKETLVSLLTARGRYAEAWSLLDTIEQNYMNSAMPLYGQLVAGKLVLQRAIILFVEPGRGDSDRRHALDLLAVALARVYVLGALHHEQRSFEHLAARLVSRHVSPALLTAFVADLNEERYLVSREGLTFQRDNRLTRRRWSEAWERMISYFSTLLEETVADALEASAD
ncbi:MAG: hypothetical protein HGA45_10725 [Chloroflexales bacterium]|nr:hypothetical protein [Chloroflexales bacterium]